MHEIFYDDQCPLCQRAIASIKRKDADKVFTYHPLASERAQELLPEELLKGDTLVLIEESGQMWTRSRAIFRIGKYLGGFYRSMSFLAYIPGLDWAYRLIAHNRYLFR